MSKLGLNCHCIPPIEEAFNSLQQFLQEDFPKLIKDINVSSQSVHDVSANSNTSDICGNFSVLPVIFLFFIFYKICMINVYNIKIF